MMFQSDNNKTNILSSDIKQEEKLCDVKQRDKSTTYRGKRLLRKTYGLRPRSTLRRLLIDPELCDFKPTITGKNIRGEKHAPLSKYRRKTANARERLRMKEINDAFNTLQKVLPPIHTRRTIMSSMTKITTLKLAVAYIRALSEILDEDEDNPPSETTKTLLTASNLRLWNNNILPNDITTTNVDQKPFIFENETLCQELSFFKSEPITNSVNLDSLLPQTFSENIISIKKPCREEGFYPEEDLVSADTCNSQGSDLSNLNFWEDIPLLNEFHWTYS